MKSTTALAAAMLAGLAATASAQFNNLVNGGVADWATANWANGMGVPPTAGETSFFNGDNTITIQSGTNAVADTLRLGNNNVTNSSLTLAASGSLAVTNNTYVANAAEANFFLNLDSTFTGNALFIGGANNTDGTGLIPDADGTAQVTISGGSVTLNSFIQFSLGTTGNANRLIVNGSAATLIQASQIQVDTKDINDDPIDPLEPGDIEFNFDAAGITPISLTGSLFGADSFDIRVDGSAYAGGPGSFTLIDTDTDTSGGDGIFGGPFNSIDVDNFAGLDATVSIVDGDLVLGLTESNGTVNGAVRLAVDTINEELTLRFGFQQSPNLQGFTDIDLSSATIELDPDDATNETIKVTIPGVTGSTYFVRLADLP